MSSNSENDHPHPQLPDSSSPSSSPPRTPPRVSEQTLTYQSPEILTTSTSTFPGQSRMISQSEDQQLHQGQSEGSMAGIDIIVNIPHDAGNASSQETIQPSTTSASVGTIRSKSTDSSVSHKRKLSEQVRNEIPSSSSSLVQEASVEQSSSARRSQRKEREVMESHEQDEEKNEQQEQDDDEAGEEQIISIKSASDSNISTPAPEEVEIEGPIRRMQMHYPSAPMKRARRESRIVTFFDVPESFRKAKFESDKQDLRKISLPKWRVASGVQCIQAPTGQMTWVDPFVSPHLPRALISDIGIPPDCSIEDFIAARVGLFRFEMLADDLKSGELLPDDLGWFERRMAFRVITMQERCEARTLFPTKPDQTIFPARKFSDIPMDEVGAYDIRAPMKWSRPTLHVIFDIMAAQQSFYNKRSYGFEFGKMLPFAPTALEPHVISLIATQPLLTEFNNLYLDIAGLLDCGSIADVYRGTIHTCPPGKSFQVGDLPEQPVIVKVFCPEAFDHDSTYDFATRHAKQQMINEVVSYKSNLASLQHELVPCFYGSWEWTGHLRKNAETEEMTFKPYKVYIEILEDVGLSIHQRAGVLSHNHKLAILNAYIQLHSCKMKHGVLDAKNIRIIINANRNSAHDYGIGLIDFSHAIPTRYITECWDEIEALQQLLELDWNSVYGLIHKLIEEHEIPGYNDGVGRPASVYDE
ncbi:uncharacterized protein L201_004034 [Kwoniella dendrophila CBS 6074]|uniref:Protein kinase domain-containing protein n=1 Tax=Kwoniella dendrophila CBS 6074 TaxID=1295534 RepID=A0AAX4JUK2_9TREE